MTCRASAICSTSGDLLHFVTLEVLPSLIKPATKAGTTPATRNYTRNPLLHPQPFTTPATLYYTTLLYCTVLLQYFTGVAGQDGRGTG